MLLEDTTLSRNSFSLMFFRVLMLEPILGVVVRSDGGGRGEGVGQAGGRRFRTRRKGDKSSSGVGR